MAQEKMVRAYHIREMWNKVDGYDHYFKTYAEAIEWREKHRSDQLKLWRYRSYGDSWKTNCAMLDKYSKIKEVIVPARYFEPITLKLPKGALQAINGYIGKALK